MPDTEWNKKYEKIKNKLDSRVDLEEYFTAKEIGGTDVDILDIGSINFSTGAVIACDPMVELEDCMPYIQKAPIGSYPVKICVVPSEQYGDRYACVKAVISGKKPVRYECAMTGRENLDDEIEDGEFFGFGVDAGMGCIADVHAQEEYKKYWNKRCEEESGIDSYNDLFCDVLKESSEKNPKYQSEYGDWANWTVPGTESNILIFASGWGDGVYPCYFGYDENDELCGIYIHFIDIAMEYS